MSQSRSENVCTKLCLLALVSCRNAAHEFRGCSEDVTENSQRSYSSEKALGSKSDINELTFSGERAEPWLWVGFFLLRDP